MAFSFATGTVSLSLSGKRLVPGIVLVALVTAAAFGLRELSLFSKVSAMMGAIVIGVLVNNVIGIPENAYAGIAMCGKRLLRLAVALLGIQLTVWQIAAIGFEGVALAAVVLTTTFAFTAWLGRLMGVDRGLSLLIAAGTSVCGASAIAAMNDVSKARAEDVSYAIAAITLFGTLAMFLYPMLIGVLNLSPEAYGSWVGVSVHEVAQVVAAAFQGGEIAGRTGVVVKLTRVMMLAPLILVVGAMISNRSSTAGSGAPRQPVPIFVLGFIGCMLLNSLVTIPDAVRAPIVSATPIMLTASLGAIGLGTNAGRLRQRGMRPLLLAGAATTFISVTSVAIILLLT